VAFTHVVHAHAASAAGARDQHARSYAAAVGATLRDPVDARGAYVGSDTLDQMAVRR